MSGESFAGFAIEAIERGFIPDTLVRAGIRKLLRQRLKNQESGNCEEHVRVFQNFVQSTRQGPIAFLPEKANEQHYEVPAAFYEAALGHRLKYSCCCFEDGITTLDQAEDRALEVTCQRAGLTNGQRILELGCGWGSLSLWMAEKYPGSQITSVSNSSSQREYIMSCAEQRGLTNLQVVTADMNDFSTDETFDRCVSIEMFEHMRNYELLLSRVAGWLVPGGRLFVHIFCHKRTPYVFETDGASNWMGRYFFSGGTMPSDDLFYHYQSILQIIDQWRWNGRHYGKTSNAWLARQDAARHQLMPVLEETYGKADAYRWFMRWRMFFMSCAELFDFNKGEVWWVSHYLFEKPDRV